jgi:predicted ATPase
MATTEHNSIGQLVGRKAEIDIVSDAVVKTGNGRGAVLLFAGEPGIGKSTLARFGAAMASEQRMAVYWGFSWEAGGAPAYWPWTQLLRSLISDQAIDADRLAPLGQILPELAVAKSSEPELQPDQARFLLLESVRSLLVTLAAATPLVLILEDLHAADSDSLHLLHYLSRHAASLPLLIIGTYRNVEARSSVHTEPLWQTSRNATVLRLPRLDESDIRDYLQLRDGDSPDDAAVQRLLQTTAGNPLFLSELVGLLARDSDAASSHKQLPDSVQQVIRQQLALLPPAASSLLASASVFGREFAAPELASMIGQSESEVLQNLQPAIDAEVVRASQEGRFRFGHALYRDVLYQDLGASSRAEAHLSCAQRLRHLIDEGDVDQW